ncbi:MAG: S8 family serine peptidase [Nocardioides sp.]|nr:S8 family serine peptidase [Nocardioides sp.]
MKKLTAGSLGVLLGSLALVSVGAAPSYAEGEDPCNKTIIGESELTADTEARVSTPLVRMHVPEAQKISRGAGVTVAVLDSGVGAGLGVDVLSQSVPSLQSVLLSGHGTIVGGLIAGPDGVAPKARILSMRVLDKDEPDPQRGERGVSSALMAQGIDQLVALHRTVKFQVVNISLAVRANDPVLEAAVKRLAELDVVIVAASGNKPTDEDGNASTEVTSDAKIFPADYKNVLAVNAIGPSTSFDVRDYVMPNADTDVAAPTVGAISVNLNGQRCQIGEEIATSYAAAEVSGVVALLRSRFPKESPKQIVARLKRTAEGSEDSTNPWTGAGVVQAADALTRQLVPSKKGETPRTTAEVRADAQAPPAPVRIDAYGPSRTMLMWFALGASALLALALMTRPLFRRTSSG